MGIFEAFVLWSWPFWALVLVGGYIFLGTFFGHLKGEHHGIIPLGVLALMCWLVYNSNWAGAGESPEQVASTAVAATAAGVAWFTFGTLSFWILAVIWFCGLFFVVEREDATLGFIATLIVSVILLIQNGINLVELARNEPASFFSLLVGYVGLGIAWAFFKWYRLVRNKAKEGKKIVDQFFADLKRDSEKDELRSFFPADHRQIRSTIDTDLVAEAIAERRITEGYVRDRWDYNIKRFFGTTKEALEAPRASNYRGPIITWMMFWPWSAVWYVFRKFVLELFETIYDLLKNSFQSVADRQYKDVKPDGL